MNANKKNKVVLIAILVTVFVISLGIVSLCIFDAKSNTEVNINTSIALYSDTEKADDEKAVVYNNLCLKNGDEYIEGILFSEGIEYSFEQFGYTVNGEYSNYAGTEKMEYFYIDDFSFKSIYAGTEIMSFKGWKFENETLQTDYLTQGTWSYIDTTDILYIDAVWEPVTFNLTLQNGSNGSNIIKRFNYIDGITLDEDSKNGYSFEGWADDNFNTYKEIGLLEENGVKFLGFTDYKGIKHSFMSFGDLMLTAKWTKLYKLEFESKIHYISYEFRGVREGEYWVLPEYSSANYKMTYWYATREKRTYSVNTNYQAVRDEYFEAIWEKRENFTDFSGGNGTSSKPYKITKASQMLNIERVDMSAHYVLCNDIDLSAYSNWTPIGGCYKEKAFSGVFDGGLYFISNLTRTANIAEKNSRIYFGLFGYLTGTVKNVIFTNVNINMNGPSVNNADTRVFIGILAASINGGRVENVHTASGTGVYSVCTNGKAYVGPIAGIANNATITNCRNDIDIISGRYSATAGGICGYIGGTRLSNCTNNGNVTTYGTGVGGYVASGGIAGERYTGNTSTITNCTNNGGLFTKKYGGGLTLHKYTGQEVAREYGTYLD